MSIKKLRVKLGLTQLEFGKLFGIPLRTIQNWEAYESGKEIHTSRKPPKYLYTMLGIIFNDWLEEIPEESVAFLEKFKKYL